MEEGIIKPQSQRHKRLLEDRASKIFENDKSALFIRGGNTSNIVTTALQELHIMKKTGSILFRKRNVSRPFENQSSVEFLTKMNDASLFMFGCHSKKRPHNLVIGRTYDHQVLDMVELGIENFQSFKEIQGGKCAAGTKPCLIFIGDNFESDNELRRLKSLFMDFFRGPSVTNISLQGLEHVISFTAIDDKVLMRNFKTNLKKSGTRTPRIELTEMGPNIDFIVRRTKLASDDLYKRACRKPKAAKASKVKNISRDSLGEKHGRIHMTRQNIQSIQLRKVKALKRKLPSEIAAKKSKKKEADKDV